MLEKAGLVPTGGACFHSSEECASPQDACVGSTCPRRCQSTALGGQNQPCRRVDRLTACDPGLYCNQNETCEAKHPPGASCDGWDGCHSSWCEFGANGFTCVAYPGPGSACQLPQSPGPHCSPDTYCGKYDICTVPTKKVNAPCVGYDGECLGPSRMRSRKVLYPGKGRLRLHHLLM